MTIEKHRRFITPDGTSYTTYPPQLGEDESHPLKDESTNLTQWVANNLAYCHDHVTSGEVITDVTPSAAAAKALIQGARFGSVVLAPIGADDATRSETVYAACATAGFPVCHSKGAWQAATECTVPSPLSVKWSPNSTIACSMASAGGGAATNSCFRAFPTENPSTPTTATVLSAGKPTVVGSNVIYTDAALTVGATISICVSYLWYRFDVIQCEALAAGYKVTLDEAVQKVFPAG